MPSTSTHLPLVPHVCVSIVSGNGLLPGTKPLLAQYSTEPCCQLDPTEQIQWKSFYRYFIHLFIRVHKIWIELELKENELNWNWIERFWIWLNLNWIEKILNPAWIAIELNWKKLIDPSPGDIDLGQQWLRQWLDAWQHQAIIWTNVDFSLVRVCGIHWRNFTARAHAALLYYDLENYSFKIGTAFPRGQ